MPYAATLRASTTHRHDYLTTCVADLGNVIDREAAGSPGRLQVVCQRLAGWGSLVFVGEGNAGAAFLRRNGMVWTTDKDGLAPTLLSAEITAVLERDSR